MELLREKTQYPAWEAAGAQTQGDPGGHLGQGLAASGSIWTGFAGQGWAVVGSWTMEGGLEESWR